MLRPFPRRPWPDSCVSLEEAARELGVTRRRVWQLCQLGRIQGARLVLGRWAIPSPVECLDVRPDGCLDLEEAARELGVTRRRVWQLCQLGRIQGARLVLGRWAIPSPVERLDVRPDGCLDLEEAARELGVTRQRVWELCQLGRIQGARVILGKWPSRLPWCASPQSVVT